ncbi:tetraprenyl-beta-curcumene synthase family protein [Thermaerobacter composti]|uniref:Tetraprenyl-beta-curcumene synthase family protein n=1 Tax=Thermaerobacter composti TaxID=554949 RepID=A0ABZ0QPG5_9FIRM|nr:tetraprenyl-beta-curcumene synthase family protein [Thermaerobacter composti]WPD19376.1 tetraprenyl-beta-curcumene synthase family protein [Thermaerobacter composti]
MTYVRRVLPLVDEALDRWQRRAAAIPDPELRRQALASIRTKRFHCEGGAVFAAAVPPARRRALVEAVVALQTISDYLDNLCDRSESLDPADYRQLHRAMLDAVTPAGTAAGAPPSAAGASATTAMRAMAPEGGGHRDAAAARPSGLRATAPVSCRPAPPGPPLARRPDAPSRPGPGPSSVAPVAPASPPALPGAANGYYRLHPHGDDGGYLEALVATCRAALATFPGYGTVAGAVRRLVSLYNDLQVNKHGDPRGRQARMAAWYRQAAGRWHGRLAWWEFAAACGSTLGVFALFREALLGPDPPAPRIRRLLDAYFPWIGGLHILLDYLIDQAEDRAGGDLNLVEPYGDAGRASQGLSVFVREAARRAARLRDAPLHRLVVDGLLGLYLSDPKVAQQRLEPVVRHLLASGGAGARLCFAASRFVRRWRRPGG